VALASLDVFEQDQTLANLPPKIEHLRRGLAAWQARETRVHEVRQCGLVAGIELRKSDGRRFPPEQRVGEQVCLAARKHGLLTRPILDTLVLMPPLCVTPLELDHAISALEAAVCEVL
jgi:adenosylmethionine-8-amino-7-oxononanoate aminotransferase